MNPPVVLHPEPRKLLDLMDNAEAYISLMRKMGDSVGVSIQLQDYVCAYMQNVAMDHVTIQHTAIFMADHTFRLSQTIRSYDQYYCHAYFTIVMGHFWGAMAKAGVRVFFILDNEIPEERFELCKKFFTWSGFFSIAPYADGFGPDDLRRIADLQVCAGRNIAYIEKDSSINLISEAIALAKGSGYTAFFRNLGHDDPHVCLLN